MVHRCPRCGGSRAERRTAKNYRERAALAIFGFHPYRCLDCDRRFLDRPLSERTGHDDGPAAAADEPEPEAPGTPVAVGAPLDQRAATIAITTGSGSEPARVRRRARWVVDAGNGPLGRAEVYTLVVAGLLAVAVVFAVLRLMWPEATGGVKLGVD